MKDTLFSIKKTLNTGGKLLTFDQPLVMGILNVTPDSFYTASRIQNNRLLLMEAEKMLKEGAFALDVGGYSSRPGAEDISEAEETRRVIPAIEQIKKEFSDCLICVDTFRSSIAEKAINAGARMVNDISGGELDHQMFPMIGKYKIPYILMHMKGKPQNMKLKTDYDNLFKEIAVYFSRKINQLQTLGISDIIIDPGFGFAKNIGQNYELLKNLSYFNMVGFPIMAALSRKSMVYRTLNTTAEEALNGTTVINTLAILKKASILRVHDVKEAIEVIIVLKEGNFDISD